MNAFTGFEEFTGECLASCGGDSISGHKKNCELGKAAAELSALREQVARVESLIAELRTAQDDEFDLWAQKFENALKGGGNA